MSRHLLTASEVAAKLGWSLATFYRYRRTHAIKSMRAPNALGNRCYIAALVDAYNQGQSTTRLVRRTA